jgi:hypothetical protein
MTAVVGEVSQTRIGRSVGTGAAGMADDEIRDWVAVAIELSDMCGFWGSYTKSLFALKGVKAFYDVGRIH